MAKGNSMRGNGGWGNMQIKMQRKVIFIENQFFFVFFFTFKKKN